MNPVSDPLRAILKSPASEREKALHLAARNTWPKWVKVLLGNIFKIYFSTLDKKRAVQMLERAVKMLLIATEPTTDPKEDKLLDEFLEDFGKMKITVAEMGRFFGHLNALLDYLCELAPLKCDQMQSSPQGKNLINALLEGVPKVIYGKPDFAGKT